MDKKYYEEKDSLRYTSFDDNINEKLIITIDIGDGRRDEIVVRENDNPANLAEAFCVKHHLNQLACKIIIEQIEKNIETKIDEQNNSLFSINKSYDSKNKKNIYTTGRSSSGMFNDFNTFSINQTTPSLEEKSPIIKPKEPKKQSVSPINKSVSPINNYGEKLYFKGLRFIEKVEKKKLEIKVQQSEKELKETTFSPFTNSKSDKRSNLEGILLTKGKQAREKIEKNRGLKLAEELSECTFSPMIRGKTEKKAEKNLSDRFTQLYENAKAIQTKILTKNVRLQNSECPFTPDTRLTRLANSKMTEKREKINKSRKAIEEYLAAKTSNKDPQTGQDLFKPVTGRPPKGRAPQGQKIGEYLYTKRSKSSEPSRPSANTSKLSTQQSEKILKRIKELRFKQIFDHLKPNQHERITPEGVRKSSLSPRTLKILSPFLEEMQSLDEKLNFAEFSESMELFIRSLRPNERSVLLRTCKEKTQEEALEFRPKINESSILRPKSVENLYERGVKQKQWAKEKSEQWKKEKDQSELDECTFKPKILKYSNELDESEELSLFPAFKPLSESYFY